METKHLSPFGMEVGLDIRAPMSHRTVAELRSLLAEHQLLLFRGQKLAMDQQIRFAKRFGPVVSANGMTIGEYISNCRPDGVLGNAELCFHSDLSFSRHPYQAVCMHAIDVVNGASSTRFASGARAYDLLPVDTRKRLTGLQALLVWPLNSAGRNRDADVPPHYPRAIQPLVWVHPTTGRSCLYLDLNATDRVLGLPPDESEALLQELWGYELAPDNIYEHRWNKGDLILWDNMPLLHARGDISSVGNRTLQRVTIAEKGYADIFPQVDVQATSIGKQDPVIEVDGLDQAA